MDTKAKSLNMAFTQLVKRQDDLYHRYAVFCGLSDPAIWVLYALYADGDEIYTQNDLVSMWFYPKQTINYAVSCLVKQGLVGLSQLSGSRNSKAISLTEEGRCLCEEKIRPLILAEERSLTRLGEDGQQLLLKLTEQQCTYFEEEILKLTGGK